jgi:hypothetical protein
VDDELSGRSIQDDADIHEAWDQARQQDEDDGCAEWVADLVKRGVVRGLNHGELDDLADALRDAWLVRNELGTDGRRAQAANRLIERLVPQEVDMKLWRDFYQGKTVRLQDCSQYGERKSNTKAHGHRGNDYGKVHSKDEAPSQFISRQGDDVAREAKHIRDLEMKLEQARRRKAALEEGNKVFALTVLLTQMRKAVAPIFSVGPAWTVLRAIAGLTGKEFRAEEATNDTHRIMVTLHALCEHEPFEQELKDAILRVCAKYHDEAKVRRRPFSEFDAPYDYEYVLNELKMPRLD